MNTNLKKFIRRFVKLSDPELEEIASKFKRKEVKKNNYVFKQDDTCKDFVFVDK